MIEHIPACDREDREARKTERDAAFQASLPIDSHNLDTLLQSANDTAAAFSLQAMTASQAVGRLMRICAQLARVAASGVAINDQEETK